MRLKKKVALMLAMMMTLTVPLLAFPGCSKKNPGETTDKIRDYTESLHKTYAPTLAASSGRIEIGVENVQKWVFVKRGANWLFDGVYAVHGGKPDRVFVGSSGKLDSNDNLLEDGYYFTVASTLDDNGVDKQVSGMVTDISVTKDEKDEKVITLQGKGFEGTLKASKTSQFVERIISLTPTVNTDVREGDISFVLRGRVEEYAEQGYILSRVPEDNQYSLPYSFPALAGKLTRLNDESKVFTYINVIDYNNTDECFKTARRRIGLNYYFEEGILSSEGSLDSDNDFIERVCVRSGNNDSFYDLIYDARYEYGQIYDLDVEALVMANSNMNVYDWDEAAYGATYDIMDSRGRPLGDEVGAWGPYGYQNGGTESFGSMNTLKGMVRYALATDDQEMYDFAMKYALIMVTPDPVYGKCYVMPLSKESKYAKYNNDDYFFFMGCYNEGKEYVATDTYMGAGMEHFISFKYYSRVSQLGELALLTGNDALKTAYLNLMVFVKRLKTDGFAQAVEWGLDGLPKLDYENGGSSGSEAMWANCMYIASELTDDSSEKAVYLDYMKQATDLANKQGFARSSSLRQWPKPESCGYMVRANIAIYKQTGDKSYLNYALTAAQGIYFFYYHNTNPYTYFQTFGYGYACAHERWEAFMEMVESLELLVGVFEYYNDPLLFELYLTLRESALSALPVNGYPEGILGGHADWVDALFVPFEQPTGVIGDNGLADGGAASYRRWSKEMYGIGEIYFGALMFSTQGKAADPTVLVLNYTSSWLDLSRETNGYKLFNFGEGGDKIVAFPNYDDGVYTINADGKSLGNYTAEQMTNGIALRLEKEKPVHVKIAPSKTSASAQTVNKETQVSFTEMQSDSVKAQVTAQGASYYRLYVSRSSDFNKYTTTSKFSEDSTFELGFEDSSELYIKAVAYDKNGNAFKESELYTLKSNDVNIGVQDDFASGYLGAGESQPGWTARSATYQGKISFGTDLGDFQNYPENSDVYRDPTGYMGVYKPAYAGNDVDTFTKIYSVNLNEYPLFDFYPFTKNFGSQFSLKVEVGGKQYTLMDRAESFDLPNYRFDLAKITGANGGQEVKVIMVSEGRNRGFAVTKLRFVNEAAYNRYDLIPNFDEAASTAELGSDGVLTVENGSDLEFANEFKLPQFDPADYASMEILPDGITQQQSGFLKADVEIGEGDAVVLAKSFGSLTSGSTISIPLKGTSLAAGKYYTAKFKFSIVGKEVSNVNVKSIRLLSDTPSSETDGFDPEKGYVPTVQKTKDGWLLANGWVNNWAFVNPDSGYIYNGNSNVSYGSIRNTALIDLDDTPVVRFIVSDNKGGVTWQLKANDGMLANDILLMESSGKGTFDVNIKDAFNRSGVINLRLDFYVIHEFAGDDSKGVLFDGCAFIKGKDLYNNTIKGAYSVTQSKQFTLNTDKTNYLILDIPELTYGATWLVYLVDGNGTEYELKTVYEKVYSNMYSRTKEGIFKYELTDILPANLQGKDANFTLKIVLSGEETSVTFGSIRLASDNDTLVLQEPCKIR